ncbi:hypothetical protein RUND412_007302 [Rhizina undulata]
MSPSGSDNRATSAVSEDAEAGNASSATGEKQSARNPACDLCREKKVRCGREKPTCLNCRTWKASCTYSERQKRDNEASRNAQRFEEVHDRLDGIESRLERMESTMSRIATLLESSTQQKNPAPVTISRTPAPSPSSSSIQTNLPNFLATRTRSHSFSPPSSNSTPMLVADCRGDLQYLGPSSLLSITNEAGVLAEERLRLNTALTSKGGASARGDQSRNPGEKAGLAGLNPKLGRMEEMETIGALKGLKSMGSKVVNIFPHYGAQELRMGSGGASMGMPPKDVAEILVNEYFEYVNVWFPLFDAGRFKEKFHQYYSDPKSVSTDRAWLVCFNNVLIFGSFGGVTYPRGKAGFVTKDCFRNAWAAIDDLEVFMSPRLINVQALMTATVVATEIFRPGLCWSCLSQAARLSQAIGLHRSSNPANFKTKAELEERKMVFWNVYALDKSLSLTFGRPPCLPDFDVDVELPEDDGSNPYFHNFLASIWLAKIQSSIYVRLYSANSGKQSDEEREKAIIELDAELRRWWEEEKMFDKNGKGKEKEAIDGASGSGQREKNTALDSFSLMETRFSYFSNMTLVHRKARPGGASEKICLESARECIRLINNVVENDVELANSGMLLWLFQYYPFTSFFVLFAEIIRNPSAPSSRTVDFPLMQALVAYLSAVKTKSEGAAKLLQIAEAFTHVAGTFLKNWSKHIEHSADGPPRSKRRKRDREPPQDIEVGMELEKREGAVEGKDMGAEFREWTKSGIKDRVFKKGFGKGFYSTAAFPQEQQEQFLDISSSSADDSDTRMVNFSFEDTNHNVAEAPDLHPASFLRWPSGTAAESVGGGGFWATDTAGLGLGAGFGGGLGEGMESLEALMAEPVDFQMQMEMAARRGPLEFDWLSWDGQFS